MVCRVLAGPHKGPWRPQHDSLSHQNTRQKEKMTRLLARMHSTTVEPTKPTTIINLSRQQQDLWRQRQLCTTSATERMNDEDDKNKRWNMAAAGCGINQLGPTVRTHNGDKRVHIDDYRRVKREWKEMVDWKDWDNLAIKELAAQVSELREQYKWSTAKKGLNSLAMRREEFTPEDHANESNVYTKVKELFNKNNYTLEGWHRFSENSNTVCGHMMSSVSLSHGQDKKRYWGDFAGAVTNRCWIDLNLRTIKEKYMCRVCNGETLVALCRDDILWTIITCC